MLAWKGDVMATESGELRLEQNQDISIAQLQEHMRDGFSVVRSPHIGNMAPYNLALAEAGVKLLLVDHMIVTGDKTYRPNVQIAAGKPSAVTTQRDTVVFRTPSSQEGVFVDELHMQSLASAVPGVDMVSNSDYLRQNESISRAVLQVAVQEMPELFDRVILSDGTTRADASRARQLAMAGTVAQLEDDIRAETEAAKAPNVADIVTGFVVEAVETQRDVQYHISGPAMVNYCAEGMAARAEIEKLYNLVATQTYLKGQLPGQLTVVLTKATDAQFLLPSDRVTAIEALERYQTYVAVDAEAKQRRNTAFSNGVSPASEEGQLVIAEARDMRAAAIELLGPSIAELREIVLGSADNPTGLVTQYDVLAAGGLYQAAMNREQTFAELAVTAKAIRKLKEPGNVS